MNSEEFRETFLRSDREGPTKAKMAEKAAETHAGREERLFGNREIRSITEARKHSIILYLQVLK